MIDCVRKFECMKGNYGNQTYLSYLCLRVKLDMGCQVLRVHQDSPVLKESPDQRETPDSLGALEALVGMGLTEAQEPKVKSPAFPGHKVS